jgi:hypothetical protein
MKRALLLVSAMLSALPAMAADPIPAHLAGAWGTAESLYSGTVGQFELLLLADGFGTFTASTPPRTHNDGPDKGKRVDNARVVMGLPLRAAFEGDTLKVQPFVPSRLVRAGDNGPTPEQMAFTCRYEAQGPSLRCSGVGPERIELVMKRYLESVPAETVEMLRKIQAGDGKG